MNRTRIKICGVTRPVDVVRAAAYGVDAVGFNCYPASPRFVPVDRLPELARELTPFVMPVLLFVNAAPNDVERAIDNVPDALLQFHGDETEADCSRFGRPYVRAVHVGAGTDLLDCERAFCTARALLADAAAVGYGGSGVAFDWAVLPTPAQRRKPLILAGGLNEGNVVEAIRRVRPYAVDVSSGVEESRGIKSDLRMQRFIESVHAADFESR